MAGQRVLTEARNLGVAHAFEIIVLLIVLADMIHAELEILAVAATTLRRLVQTGFIAALPLALGRARFLLGALLALSNRRGVLSKYFESSFIAWSMRVRACGNKAARNRLISFATVQSISNRPFRCRAHRTKASTKHHLQRKKMSVTGRLREKLMVGLRPTRLDVVNESELHAGHRNSPGTGESHFRILVVSEAFFRKITRREASARQRAA